MRSHAFRHTHFFFSSRRRHTRSLCDWSSDVCSSDLRGGASPGNVTSTYCSSSVRASSARRSEERRVGKECRARGWPYDEKKKNGKRGSDTGEQLPLMRAQDESDLNSRTSLVTPGSTR